MEIKQKTNYAQVPRILLRERYKRLPNISRILRGISGQNQETENELFKIISIGGLNTIDTWPRDFLNKKAASAGIFNPEAKTADDLRLELRALAIVNFSSGKLSDIKKIVALLGYTADYVETGGGIEIVVYGDISSNNGKKALFIYRHCREIISAGLELHHVAEAQRSSFAFAGFTRTLSWKLNDSPAAPAATLSKIVVNRGELV